MKTIYLKTIGQRKLSKIDKEAKGCWIDIQNPSNDDILLISHKFNLETDAIEDILDRNEIPKIEKLNKALLIILKVPSTELKKEGLDNLSILIDDENFISISSAINPLINNVLGKFKDLHTTQRSKLVFFLLQEIANEYLQSIETIRRKIETLKKNIETISDYRIMQLVKYEETLNNFNLALQPTKYILNKIKTGKYISLYKNDEEILQDMYEDFNQAAEVCLLNLKSIVTLRDSYKILMDLNLNKTIKLLTSVTVILTIPTIITSMFGMNVDLPVASSIEGFYAILAIISVSLVALVMLFIWKKWL